MTRLAPPSSESELMARTQSLVGLSIGQIANQHRQSVPVDSVGGKGFLGMLLELALGTSAKNQSLPDFVSLGIELKTLPLGRHLQPSESTFVTSIPLREVHRQTWETSSCYAKLKRVLWIPLEGDPSIPLQHRRIGEAFLWSPHDEDWEILKQDWSLLVNMIVLGQLDKIDARIGRYLQIRPKAANNKVLCQAYGPDGALIQTLPRGFYLRREFTAKIFLSR